MPKGSGMLKEGSRIEEAFKADVESLGSSSVNEAPKVNGSEIQRINITIEDALLKVVDRRVFELKQQGVKTSRSQLISEGLRKILST